MDNHIMVEETYNNATDMKELVGDRWREACVIQAVCSPSSEHHMADAVNRTATHALDDGEPYEDDENAIDQVLEEDADEGEDQQSRLSTIPEEDENDQSLWHIMDSMFSDRTPDLDEQALLAA